MPDTNSLEASAVEQPTTELLWNLIHWAEIAIGGKGCVRLSHVVHDFHTTTRRRQDGYEGFRMEAYGSMSQFGGENIKIWFDPTGEVGRTLVFDANYWPTSKEPTINKLVNFNVWFPHVETYVNDWVKADQRKKDKLSRDARNINLKRATATSFVASEAVVHGISFVQDSTRWKNILKHGQEIGLLPFKEVWNGETIEVCQFGSTGVDHIYVNCAHPDYEKWQKLSLLEKPEFMVRDKPNKFILPAWARFLDLK